MMSLRDTSIQKIVVNLIYEPSSTPAILHHFILLTRNLGYGICLCQRFVYCLYVCLKNLTNICGCLLW